MTLTPADLTEFPLPGEEPDRGFSTPSGNRFRVRVRKTSQEQRNPGSPNAAPTRFTLTVTVAALEADASVATLGDAYRIFDRAEVSIGDDELSLPNFRVDAAVMAQVAISIDAAERILAAQAAAHDDLAAWGLSFTPEPAPSVAMDVAEPAPPVPPADIVYGVLPPAERTDVDTRPALGASNGNGA